MAGQPDKKSIQDTWDKTRCGERILVSNDGKQVLRNESERKHNTVLGSLKVSAKTASKVEWRVKNTNAQEFWGQYIGVALLSADKKSEQQRDYNNYDHQDFFMMDLNSGKVKINGDLQKIPDLAGSCQGEEELIVAINFAKEEILIKRAGKKGVVIAKGQGIGKGTFSLLGILADPSQSIKILSTNLVENAKNEKKEEKKEKHDPKMKEKNGPQEKEDKKEPHFDFEPALEILGLSKDKEFREAYKRVKSQLNSKKLVFEKRLAFQCLLNNEVQFNSLADRLGQPQHDGLTNEQAVEQMISLSQVPFLSTSPPNLFECQKAISDKQEKSIRRLTSLLAEFTEKPQGLKLQNLALSISEVFQRLPMPDRVSPPPSMKDHLLSKSPALFERMKNFQYSTFKDLTGKDPKPLYCEKLEQALLEAMKEAKRANEAPLPEAEQPVKFMKQALELNDDDV